MCRRCAWVDLKDPIYIKYHDTEWGVPLHDDRALFELLILEGFQAGLSWQCILRKREAFVRAFDGFDPHTVASYSEDKMNSLMLDASIVRNRRKISAAVDNARVFLNIAAEFGSFDAYIWGFSGGQTIVEEYTLRTTSPLSDRISSDLRSRGMRFVGSTIIYSYLQAIGVIYAHGRECDMWQNNF